MNKEEAYRFVIDDIVKNGPSFFTGHYDRENGNPSFINGIQTVMTYLAYNVSEEFGIQFDDEFTKNREGLE